MIYGKWPVFVATSVLTAVGMVAVYALDVHGLLWPFQIALIGVSTVRLHIQKTEGIFAL